MLQAIRKSPQPTFHHGVHPEENKGRTNRLPVARMPFVGEYVLPLSQHLGAPSPPIVVPGQRVERGEAVARPGGFVSVSLHSPVTGTVKAIELRPHPNGKLMPAVVVQADPFASQRDQFPAVPDPLLSARETVLQHIQSSGMVGLGGAAFPSHVKAKVPDGKRVQFAVLNGCECEPYLTCDHRVMVENPGDVIRGFQILLSLVGAERGYIGVELNKADAIAALRAAVGRAPLPIEILGLEVKYPQGAEKMLLDAIFHREVPSGKLPLDLEIVVNNVGTAAAIAQYFDTGKPLIERVVTVTGDAVSRPANLLVPIGTPVSAVLEHCGLRQGEARQVIVGGPMMGLAQKDLDVPVLKGTSGILAFTSETVRVQAEMPCIRCGRCLDACPVFLNPSRLAMLVRTESVDELERYHLLDCFECASCSFVCPSSIPLVQLMRVGKGLIRQKKSSK
ncbi:MAG: electron transport complex subunit RsxC [Candidatus Schekmanbacteria bacterium]|nr:electron transport complex subunit RsxC [Candidatus Schekmanbacteria bacterium]